MSEVFINITQRKLLFFLFRKSVMQCKASLQEKKKITASDTDGELLNVNNVAAWWLIVGTAG